MNLVNHFVKVDMPEELVNIVCGLTDSQDVFKLNAKCCCLYLAKHDAADNLAKEALGDEISMNEIVTNLHDAEYDAKPLN